MSGLIKKINREHCVNCGKKHNDINGYCQECSARFRRWGMWDYIDARGFRFIETGESCSHGKFRPRGS